MTKLLQYLDIDWQNHYVSWPFSKRLRAAKVKYGNELESYLLYIGKAKNV